MDRQGGCPHAGMHSPSWYRTELETGEETAEQAMGRGQGPSFVLSRVAWDQVMVKVISGVRDFRLADLRQVTSLEPRFCHL